MTSPGDHYGNSEHHDEEPGSLRVKPSAEEQNWPQTPCNSESVLPSALKS